ncbi:hypothetical protein U1Q18_032628, partial [Sarracenia purpurea var. burkii]
LFQTSGQGERRNHSGFVRHRENERERARERGEERRKIGEEEAPPTTVSHRRNITGVDSRWRRKKNGKGTGHRKQFWFLGEEHRRREEGEAATTDHRCHHPWPPASPAKAEEEETEIETSGITE